MNERSKVSILTLTCQEAARLSSAALDRELTGRERWALRLHTMICGVCRQFAVQLRTIHQAVAAMPRHLRQKWSDEAVRLSAERRATIKQLLAEASRGDS